MKYPVEKIRNICLMGHGGDGKTSLMEAMLFFTGAIDRLGKTYDGNTVSDFDPEEIKRTMSVSASLANFEWQGVKINLVDTPGTFDFAGEVKQALRVVGTAILVVDGKSGPKVGTELCWDMAGKLPKAFFVNKMDISYFSEEELLSQLQKELSEACLPFVRSFELRSR